MVWFPPGPCNVCQQFVSRDSGSKSPDRMLPYTCSKASREYTRISLGRCLLVRNPGHPRYSHSILFRRVLLLQQCDSVFELRQRMIDCNFHKHPNQTTRSHGDKGCSHRTASRCSVPNY